MELSLPARSSALADPLKPDKTPQTTPATASSASGWFPQRRAGGHSAAGLGKRCITAPQPRQFSASPRAEVRFRAPDRSMKLASWWCRPETIEKAKAKLSQAPMQIQTLLTRRLGIFRSVAEIIRSTPILDSPRPTLHPVIQGLMRRPNKSDDGYFRRCCGYNAG